MKYRYYIVDCEEGTVRGTSDRTIAEWYGNGYYHIIIDTENATSLIGTDDLQQFSNWDIPEAVHPEDSDDEDYPGDDE